jgi:valyl-tRNA synthetase
VAEWPETKLRITNYESHEGDFEILRSLVTDIRRLRSENHVEPAKFVKIACVVGDEVQRLITENEVVVKQLTRLESLDFVEAVPQGWPTAVSGMSSVGLDLAGSIDVAAEKAKLQKEIDQLKPETKLQDKDFASKAPEKVVASMQAKVDEAKAKLTVLEERLSTLG